MAGEWAMVSLAAAGDIGMMKAETCELAVSRALCDPEWDEFVADRDDGHHEQSSLWAQVKAVYGWQPLRLTLRRGSTIVAGAQILTKQTRFGVRVGFISRGPVVGDQSVGPLLIEHLNRVARAEGLAYLAVTPSYDGAFLVPELQASGFLLKPPSLPPGGLTDATVILDMSSSVSDLLAGMRRSTRRAVLRGEAKGLTFREGTESDLKLFRELMLVTCRRRGVAPTPPQEDFFEQLWKVFHPHGAVNLFFAEVAGEPVSTALFFPFGKTVRGWKRGWSGAHGQLEPNEALDWAIIQWAKQRGYRFYDFIGIERELARQLLEGVSVDWNQVSGASRFKLGFGGAPAVLPLSYYRSYHPVARILLRTGGSRLAESSGFAKLLERYSG